MAETSPRQGQYIDAKTSLRAILASNPSTSPTSTSTIIDTASPSTTPLSASNPPTQSQNQSESQKALANLISQTNHLNKQSTQAEKLFLQTTAKLKEFGDLQTWAEVVWREIYVLEEVLALGDEVLTLGDETGR